MMYLNKKLIIILAVFSMASFLQASDIDSNPPRKADKELFWSSYDGSWCSWCCDRFRGLRVPIWIGRYMDRRKIKL